MLHSLSTCGNWFTDPFCSMVMVNPAIIGIVDSEVANIRKALNEYCY